jgi:hypothetical protein
MASRGRPRSHCTAPTRRRPQLRAFGATILLRMGSPLLDMRMVSSSPAKVSKGAILFDPFAGPLGIDSYLRVAVVNCVVSRG